MMGEHWRKFLCPWQNVSFAIKAEKSTIYSKFRILYIQYAIMSVHEQEVVGIILYIFVVLEYFLRRPS